MASVRVNGASAACWAVNDATPPRQTSVTTARNRRVTRATLPDFALRTVTESKGICMGFFLESCLLLFMTCIVLVVPALRPMVKSFWSLAQERRDCQFEELFAPFDTRLIG